MYHIKEPGLHLGDDGKSLEAFNQKYDTYDVESNSGKSVKNDGHQCLKEVESARENESGAEKLGRNLLQKPR